MGIFNFLERQLHILFIVMIINIMTTVVHGEIINKINALVQRFVFEKMPDQRRCLHNLIQRCCIKYYYGQNNISNQVFHTLNLGLTSGIKKEKCNLITLKVINFDY